MPPPRYYKLNPRAFSAGEVLRSSGLLRFPFVYLLKPFMQPRGSAWLPHLWQELKCTQQDLSERFFKATAVHRSQLERLGFTEVALQKSRRILNPQILDSGSIFYLGGGGRHSCTLAYTRIGVKPAPHATEREMVPVYFGAVFPQAILLCTNDQYHLDPPPKRQVFLHRTSDLALLHERFLHRVNQHPEPPLQFSDPNSLQAWFDENAVEVFEHQFRRGLLIPMSEAEIQRARRATPPPLPQGPDAP